MMGFVSKLWHNRIDGFPLWVMIKDGPLTC
jgi:hypothetical protein